MEIHRILKYQYQEYQFCKYLYVITVLTAMFIIQLVQNAADRVLPRTSKFDHTVIHTSLQWLLVIFYINFI